MHREEVAQLVLLQGHPVLVEQLEVALEEVLAQTLSDVFSAQQAVEELMRDDHILRVSLRHGKRHRVVSFDEGRGGAGEAVWGLSRARVC